MTDFQIEHGLPPYGPRALSFPDPDAFSEGLVVTFTASNGERWTGNFAGGLGSLDPVRDELGSKATIVVAKGAAYLVDIDSKTASEIPWSADCVEYVASQKAFVIGNGFWFYAIRPTGVMWRSRRISWDGMRSLQWDDKEVSGEAYSPMGPPDWVPFRLHLASGEVEGGCYNGP